MFWREIGGEDTGCWIFDYFLTLSKVNAEGAKFFL